MIFCAKWWGILGRIVGVVDGVDDMDEVDGEQKITVIARMARIEMGFGCVEN